MLRFSKVSSICISEARLILIMKNMKILCMNYGKESERPTG